MATTFHVQLLTPEREVFAGEAIHLYARGSLGYLGVLAHHAALVTALAEGTLTVRKRGGAEEQWRVTGGFFEVSKNRATVLADQVTGDVAARA